MLTPADQAQFRQVVMDVGAEDFDEEEVEVTALQCHPGEAAEQAVVGEPPQDLAGPQLGPTGEPTIEQEDQVEEEHTAHEIHVQPQVDAEGLLRPESPPECPQREQKRRGSLLSEARAILQQVHTEALELPNISPSLMSPQGAAGTSYLKKMQKAMMKMEKAMATPQPAVATTIKACAMDLFRAGFCQTRTHCIR